MQLNPSLRESFMFWYNFIDIGMPLVFSPKVTPDPIDAERLQEKLQHAMQQLNQDAQRDRLRTPELPPVSISLN